MSAHQPRTLSGVERPQFGVMIGGRAPSMRSALALLAQAAASDVTVLLTGESGTGKELAAESLHMESKRRSGPLVVVDCAAIPAELLESELFGHERGSFTGAVGRRLGAFEAARGGTIFLDEIGELPMPLQSTLLRAVDSGRIKRVGSAASIESDARIVAATNRDLRAEVAARRFRADLYHRIVVIEIHLPRLAERKDDVPDLVAHLVASRWRSGAGVLTSADAIAQMQRHDWPGNVRELRNHIDRCMVTGAWVPLERPSPAPSAGAEVTPTLDCSRPYAEQRERWIRAFDVAYLTSALERSGGNIAAAARAAGIGRVQIYRLMWRYGLTRERHDAPR